MKDIQEKTKMSIIFITHNLGAGDDSDVGRKDDVPRAEEHGEQSKTHHDNFLVFRVHALTAPLAFQIFLFCLTRAREDRATPKLERENRTPLASENGRSRGCSEVWLWRREAVRSSRLGASGTQLLEEA